MQRLLSRGTIAICLLFLVGPFFIIAATSFSAGETPDFPPRGFSLRWFGTVLNIASFRAGFVTSLSLAVGGTLAALVLGVPAAYALDRYRPPGTEAVRLVVTSPLVVPGIIVGLALLRYLVIPANIPVLAALFLAHTALLIPYAVRVVSASLGNVRVDIEEAALVLGAGRAGAFFRIVLPNIRNGILAAFVLGFVTSFNQVPVSLFLSGPGVSTLPIDMLAYMEYNYDPSVAALSTLLALMSVAIVLVAERLLGLSRFV